ncbi:MAG: cob(I)yrinic acid a,c-diamide adenosyltransferase [Candidatus Promineifilaceae bacterium]|nr:cob(I)yrinic acid a,c-diamide adenosyltransferase [Candidatus Promineifilaceae bacterium]
MPRLTKIVTRKGDSGTTALSGGQRVPKNSPRVSAYGQVDELNSQIGVAIAQGLDPAIQDPLKGIQNDLFHLGSDLSFLEEDKRKFAIPQIEERHVMNLEEITEQLLNIVGPLQNFILPGGSIGSAQLHVARTVCRRAEREVISLSQQEKIGPFVIPYLNRLSDCLFVMSRYENFQKGVEEPLWNTQS